MAWRRQLRASNAHPETLQTLLSAQLDITSADIVQIRTEGNCVWVNVNGVCVLRVYRAKKIEVESQHIKQH